MEVAQQLPMRFQRAFLAASGGLLATWVLLAGLIDRAGVAEVKAYRFEVQEVVVVLGARVTEDGKPSPTLRARVEHGVGVATGLPNSVILFSGGIGTWGASEASVGRDLAVELGFPAARCLVEEESHSTAQNASFSVRLLRSRFPRGFHVTVVSDPYHLVRARMQFVDAGGVAVSSSPVLKAPRHLEWSSRVWWSLREVPAVAKDY